MVMIMEDISQLRLQLNAVFPRLLPSFDKVGTIGCGDGKFERAEPKDPLLRLLIHALTSYVVDLEKKLEDSQKVCKVNGLIQGASNQDLTGELDEQRVEDSNILDSVHPVSPKPDAVDVQDSIFEGSQNLDTPSLGADMNKIVGFDSGPSYDDYQNSQSLDDDESFQSTQASDNIGFVNRLKCLKSSKGSDQVKEKASLGVDSSQEIETRKFSRCTTNKKPKTKAIASATVNTTDKSILARPSEDQLTMKLIKDFDKIPERHMEQEPNFKYKENLSRKKNERSLLQGHACQECESYFACLEGEMEQEEIQKIMNKCSRHRSKYSPAELPNTPPGFWSTTVPPTQELYAEGYIKVANYCFDPPERKRTRYSDEEDEI